MIEPTTKRYPSNDEDARVFEQGIANMIAIFEKYPKMLDEYRKQPRKSNARGFICNQNMRCWQGLYSIKEKLALAGPASISLYAKTLNKESTAWRELIRRRLDWHYGITRADSGASEAKFDNIEFIPMKKPDDMALPTSPSQATAAVLEPFINPALLGAMTTIDPWPVGLRKTSASAQIAPTYVKPYTADEMLAKLAHADRMLRAHDVVDPVICLTRAQVEQIKAYSCSFVDQRPGNVNTLMGFKVEIIDEPAIINPRQNGEFTKEKTTMSNVQEATATPVIEIKRVVRINGRDADTYSKSHLWDMIAAQQAAIKTLEAIDPKPASLKREINKRINGVNDLVEYLDSLEDVGQVSNTTDGKTA